MSISRCMHAGLVEARGCRVQGVHVGDLGEGCMLECAIHSRSNTCVRTVPAALCQAAGPNS